MTKLFAIIHRAYYGFFSVIFVGSVLSLSYFYTFTNKTDPDWERIGYICLLMLPLSMIVHRAVHWIIWGETKCNAHDVDRVVRDLRQISGHEFVEKVEPDMGSSTTSIDKMKLSVDKKTFLENEIKQCSGYQKTWHSKLFCAYFDAYRIKSADDIPDPIRDAFYALKTNDEYLEATFEKLEEHDLMQLEAEGFPKVKELLDQIKKESKARS